MPSSGSTRQPFLTDIRKCGEELAELILIICFNRHIPRLTFEHAFDIMNIMDILQFWKNRIYFTLAVLAIFQKCGGHAWIMATGLYKEVFHISRFQLQWIRGWEAQQGFLVGQRTHFKLLAPDSVTSCALVMWWSEKTWLYASHRAECGCVWACVFCCAPQRIWSGLLKAQHYERLGEKMSVSLHDLDVTCRSTTVKIQRSPRTEAGQWEPWGGRYIHLGNQTMRTSIRGKISTVLHPSHHPCHWEVRRAQTGSAKTMTLLL